MLDFVYNKIIETEVDSIYAWKWACLLFYQVISMKCWTNQVMSRAVGCCHHGLVWGLISVLAPDLAFRRPCCLILLCLHEWDLGVVGIGIFAVLPLSLPPVVGCCCYLVQAHGRGRGISWDFSLLLLQPQSWVSLVCLSLMGGAFSNVLGQCR